MRKLKAIQIDDERKKLIERENKRLLESMAKITEGNGMTKGHEPRAIF